jgi:hypothetical protein
VVDTRTKNSERTATGLRGMGLTLINKYLNG